MIHFTHFNLEGGKLQSHSVCFCCTVLRGYVDNGLITVNPDTGTCVLKVINVPTPEDENDQDPVMTKIPVKYCPNCGEKVIVYSEAVPAPTYTRATLNGASCNDQTCRFLDRVNLLCAYQFRNDAGCYSTDDVAKQAVADLRENIFLGWQEMVNE